MKIMHLTKKYPNALGGDATVVFNLEKKQKENGDAIIILTSNTSEVLARSNVYKFGIKDKSPNLDKITTKRLLSLVHLFLISFRVLKEQKPDIIHSQSIDMAFVMSFAARLYKIPIVHTFQIVTFYDGSQPYIRRKSELILTKIANPKFITVPNDSDREMLIKAGIKNVYAIANGVDLNYWKSKGENTKGKYFTFVSVGRLESQKGFEYLIEAAALLKKNKKINFKILIVGEGSLQRALEKSVQTHDLSGCIIFLGRKTEAELKKIYKNVNAAIISSLYETGPITLLEFWAMQVPVISTKVGVLRTNKKSTLSSVVIAKTRDSNSLYKSMFEVYRSAKLRRSIVAEGKETAKAYDWSKISAEVYKLYEWSLTA